MTTHLIGARIKALRTQRKLSQQDLARLFGLRDRQTVSAIENGERRVSAEELILAVEKLGEPLDYFTDPFMLVGEGKFSWCQTNVGSLRLDAYERSAGRWIAVFRAIAPQVGKAAPLLRRALGLTRQSSFEDAMAAGERFAAEFKLGEIPATRLAEVMERELVLPSCGRNVARLPKLCLAEHLARLSAPKRAPGTWVSSLRSVNQQFV
jgi:XRE family transcriptional regulator, fatty acid utilization regulator